MVVTTLLNTPTYSCILNMVMIMIYLKANKIEYLILKGSPNNIYFGKCFKKNYWIFSQIFFFFRLIMESNFIQMAASAGHAVAYTICPIFKYIIDCVQLYFTNGFTHQLSLACRRNTYLWRHPTNNSVTVSNPSSEVAKRYQLCGW